MDPYWTANLGPERDRGRRARNALLKRAGRGQIFVILAVLIPVLLGVVAMAVDISTFDWTWSRMQAAADAAVLAGCSNLPTSPSRAIATATAYAQTDGMLSTEVSTPTVAADNLSMSITLSRTVPYYFGRVLGLTASPVVVTATAGLFTTGSVTGSMPIGLSFQTTYAYGQSITLQPGGGTANSWGALALGCTGASCYSNNLANGYPATLSVGDVVPNEPGNKTGPTATGIASRVVAGESGDPGGTWNNHTLTDQRAVIVPVVDWTGCSGSCTGPIMGFSAIWIVGANGGAINIIFIGSEATGTTPSRTAANFGTYRAVLVN
ncbi:MAG TPA: pilus assembly protein TadG-related protein [Sporolactobacillaceae bacterium]|nr:pilus assembly protein TadG-related protein [Sporolactobacillaceae bacterium]